MTVATRLPCAFWARPFAHRGLHAVAEGRAENSLAAFDAAIAGGYAIELDVQASADGEAMVFHDYTLERLAEATGRVDARSAADLRGIALHGGGTIPDLATVLARIDGRANVLIEIKDQTGDYGATDGALERHVCDIVRANGHAGTCAIMSFNPHVILAVKAGAPEIPRGIVSYDFEHPSDAHVDPARRRALADMTMIDVCEADFVSCGAANLAHDPVVALRSRGLPVFVWTIKSAAQARAALARCDQITFEGYLP